LASTQSFQQNQLLASISTLTPYQVFTKIIHLPLMLCTGSFFPSFPSTKSFHPRPCELFLSELPHNDPTGASHHRRRDLCVGLAENVHVHASKPSSAEQLIVTEPFGGMKHVLVREPVQPERGSANLIRHRTRA